MGSNLIHLPLMAKAPRPETFAEAKDKLSALEWANIRFNRWTFKSRLLNRVMQWCQKYVGVSWVHHCTKNLRHVYGLERIGALLHGQEPVIFVSNHRSFFDMYVINTVLYRAGFSQRMLFPVRANFFYDHPLGFFVNGIMSFFSMYPPIFRDRKRVVLNQIAMGELSLELTSGHSVGIHPEGTRKKDDDPYTFLPAQSGVGRLIHMAGAKVVPVFINGLGNDLKRQVASNFDGTGTPVVIVFGAPVDFEDMLEAPASGKLYRHIAERCMEQVGELGQEEKRLRDALGAPATEAAQAEPS